MNTSLQDVAAPHQGVADLIPISLYARLVGRATVEVYLKPCMTPDLFASMFNRGEVSFANLSPQRNSFGKIVWRRKVVGYYEVGDASLEAEPYDGWERGRYADGEEYEISPNGNMHY